MVSLKPDPAQDVVLGTVLGDQRPRFCHQDNIRLKFVTDVTSETTIFALKEILRGKTGIQPQHQRLFKDTEELADDKTLGYYGYWCGGTMELERDWRELYPRWGLTMASSAASNLGSNSSAKLGIMSKLRKPLGVPYFRKCTRL